MPSPRKPLFTDTTKDVHDELAAHIELRRQELVADGLPEDQARALAERRFGNVTAIARECRDIDERHLRQGRRARMWTELRQDIGYAVRLLRRAPGFTAVAIGTLALGIGATTAIFSVIEAAFLRPLPYPQPEQLVELLVETTRKDGGAARLAPSIEDVEAWRGDSDVFSQVTIWRRISRSMVVDSAALERLEGRQISQDYLALHGVTPIVGRGFLVHELQVGAEPVIMLGYGYWQDRFGRDPGVVGRTLRVDNVPATIVGVLPAAFYRTVPIWRPHAVMRTSPAGMRGSGATVYARLQPGVTIDRVQQLMTERTRARDAEGGQRVAAVAVESLYRRATAGYRDTTDVLAAAVAAVLVIACINVAGLLLARGATRRGELGIRAAIGAGRLRLVRQLLAESVVLAAAGGAAGALLAWLALDTLVAVIPMDLPANSAPALNPRVLGFAATVSITTGLLFGCAPAWSLSRVNLGGTLADARRRPGASLTRRGSQLLIGAEIAVCIVVLAGAGLMLRSFARLMAVDVGFDPASVLTLEVTPADGSESALSQYYPALVESLRHVPGVAAAGAINHMPLQGGSLVTAGRVGAGSWLSLHIREFLPGYFESTGLAVLAGRLPSQASLSATPSAVVVNARAAKEMFGDELAVGRHFEINRKGAFQVAAVVADVRHNGPLRPAEPEVYLGFGRFAVGPMVVVVRPSGERQGLETRLRQTAEAIGPRVVIDRIRSGSDCFDVRVLTPRHRTWLLGTFAALALVLALVGVFGMTAYAVARRAQEIGVRVAIGATPAQVVRGVVRESLWPVAIGIAAGIAAATMATRVIASFLFETRPFEPVTFAMVAAGMALAAALAAWLPARQAARVDPASALRSV